MGAATRWGWSGGALALALTFSASSEALPTQKEAMELAFPGAKMERRESFLTEPQVAEVKRLAGSEPRSRLIIDYEAKKDGATVGFACFDSHVVRTQQQTAMVAVAPDGSVIRVEVVVFREPQEYQAPAAWTKQLEHHKLDASLSLKGEIRPLGGASLTATALTDATRRCLALVQVLHGKKS